MGAQLSGGDCRKLAPCLVRADTAKKLTAQSNVVVVVELVDGLDLSTDVEFLDGVVQVFDSGVLLVTAEDKLCLLGPVTAQLAINLSSSREKSSLVRSIDIVDGENGQVAVITEVA